jgi:Mrp family chromosome partitioning ATPase
VVAAPCLLAPELLTLELGVLIVDADVSPAHATSRLNVALPPASSTCWPDSHEEPLAEPEQRQMDRLAEPSEVPEAAVAPVDETAFADESTLIDDSELAAVVPQSPAEEVSSTPVPLDFTPAWEVDAFRWPVLCSHWDEQTIGRVTQSGQELNIATKDGLRVLAVTSSRRTEGRTSVTLALARAAAQSGCRVALIDADAGQPDLARRLGVEAPCDWRGVLQRGEPLQEAAVASLADRVTLIPQTAPATDQARVVDVPLIRLLSDLRERFELVIVDMGPLGESPRPIEAVLPCPVDMALVIRNVTATPREESLAAVAALRAWGVRAVGVIENFVGKDELSAVHEQEG